jgi:hypothetical protein
MVFRAVLLPRSSEARLGFRSAKSRLPTRLCSAKRPAIAKQHAQTRKIFTCPIHPWRLNSRLLRAATECESTVNGIIESRKDKRETWPGRNERGTAGKIYVKHNCMPVKTECLTSAVKTLCPFAEFDLHSRRSQSSLLPEPARSSLPASNRSARDCRPDGR